MKARLIISIAAAMVSILAVSCVLQDPAGSGSIVLNFPTQGQSRSIDQTATHLRVYVMTTADSLYPIGPGGQLYDEQPLPAAGESYVSPELPAGQTYSVLIAVGKLVNGAFVTTNYGDPQPVTVSAGVSAPVSITLKNAPAMQRDLWAQNVTGISVLDPTSPGSPLYITTEQKLFLVGLSPSFTTTETAALSTDYHANSLSTGAEWNSGLLAYQATPWLNTNKGILPYSLLSSTLKTDFASGAGVADILQSASLVDPLTPTQQIVIYQRKAGLGGAMFTSGSVTVNWVDIDLSQFLTGTPILDFVATEEYAYFATSLGTFRVPESIISSGATPEQVMNAAKFFKVNSTGPEIPITSLVILSGSPNTLYMGTSNGVYTAVLNEASTDVIDQPVTLISETAGKAIRKIKALTYYYNGTKTVIAFLGDTDVFIWDGTNMTDYPFYSGLPMEVPGDLNEIAWYDSGSFVYLLVSGRKGIVVFEVAPSIYG